MLSLCQVLSDADLLVLSQVNKRLNTLALQTLFIYHGMTLSGISSGVFSLSSISLPAFRLALFIPSLSELSCTFDAASADTDIASLQHVLSRLPPIPELVITTQGEIHQSLNSTFSRLLIAIDPYKNFLILSQGFFFVSKRRRTVHSKSLHFPVESVNSPWAWIALLPFMCSFLLVQRFVDLGSIICSALSDPRARTFQDVRICNDIMPLHTSPHDVRIISPMLTSSLFAKWTMVIFDESVITTLCIEHMPFLDDEKWHSILSCLRLPNLRDLAIRRGVHISLSTLVAFINRYPTIQSLVLGHHSISYSSPPNSKLSLSANTLDQLETLCASSRFIHLLLQSTSLPKLQNINIGPEIQMDPRKFRGHGSFPDVRAKTENPFDFAALDRALATLKEGGYLARGLVNIGMTLPGRSVAKKWLIDRRFDSMLGATEMRVIGITIATERGMALDPSVIHLLADWIISAFAGGGLRSIWVRPWVVVDPNDQAVFERRIKEVMADVVIEFSIYEPS